MISSPFAFWVEPLRCMRSCFLSSAGDIVTSRGPPAPASVRFTKIHLKESNFHAWYENSFLTLITLPLRKEQMFSAEINFPTGTLIKEFRCTFLSSVVNGSA